MPCFNLKSWNVIVDFCFTFADGFAVTSIYAKIPVTSIHLTISVLNWKSVSFRNIWTNYREAFPCFVKLNALFIPSEVVLDTLPCFVTLNCFSCNSWDRVPIIRHLLKENVDIWLDTIFQKDISLSNLITKIKKGKVIRFIDVDSSKFFKTFHRCRCGVLIVQTSEHSVKL